MAIDAMAVVVPVFNRGRIVCEALASIARQSAGPDLLVVVDDGSTDDTSDRVRAWSRTAQLPFEFDLIRQTNGGAAVARNVGLARAVGCRFVAFLDSDDLWPADFLERTARLLRENETAVAASTDRTIQYATEVEARLESLSPLATDAARWLFEHHGGIASATVFRADVMRNCGGFPGELRTGHDVALFFRISRCGSWLHAPGKPVVMRRGLAASCGEADHVCRQYDDYHRQWAEIWERLAAEGHECLPSGVVRRVLASRWYRAGRQLARQNRWHEASECYRRALDWRWNAKSAWHLFSCRLRLPRRPFTEMPQRDSVQTKVAGEWT